VTFSLFCNLVSLNYVNFFALPFSAGAKQRYRPIYFPGDGGARLSSAIDHSAAVGDTLLELADLHSARETLNHSVSVHFPWELQNSIEFPRTIAGQARHTV